MSGGKDGGSAPPMYDYYGTILGAICAGQLDMFTALVVDGKAIWEGSEVRSGNKLDLTSSIDSKYFAAKGGKVILYWGTATQDVAADFGAEHPAYRNVACIGLKNFWFGTEKSIAPNIEIVGARKPVCDTSLCDGSKNVLDDGRVNTVAALAELFTSPFGLGWAVSRLDASSWSDAADWCYDNKDVRFCSPLFTDGLNARSGIVTLLDLLNARLSWTADGKLALRLLEPGVDPGGLTTLDARHFTSKPKLKVGGWGDVPTSIVVNYFDRDRKYKAADVKLDNLVALRLRGEIQRRVIDAPHITSKDQATALAAEAIRQMLHPPSSVDISVRREHAATLRTADKLLVDVDPEPGGAGLAQLGVITDRRDDGTSDIKLSVKLDPIADAIPYTPVFTPPNPQEADVNSITAALIIPLLTSQPPIDQPAFGVLAARPQADAVAMDVYFATDNAGDFVKLGRQAGFACRMSLEAGLITSGRLTVGVDYEIVDNSGGADFTRAGLLGMNTVGATFTAAVFVDSSTEVNTLVVGAVYKIYYNGTADFTTVGAPNNNIGTTFTATGSNPTWGNGVLLSSDPLAGVFTLEPVWGTGALKSSDSISTDDMVFRMTLLDGVDGFDSYIAERTAGDEITATTDKLLLVLANVDGDGKVQVDANGDAELEICSIVSRTAVDADTHNYTVLRGRRNIKPRVWTTDAQCWIIEGVNLIEWAHPDMRSLIVSGDTAYVQLAAATGYTVDTSSPLPEFQFVIPQGFNFPPEIEWTTPATDTLQLTSSGVLGTNITYTPAATISDIDGNLVRVSFRILNLQNGAETVIADQEFGPTKEVTLADVFTKAGVTTPFTVAVQSAADQHYTWTIRATDAEGRVVDNSIGVLLPKHGGTGLNLGTISMTIVSHTADYSKITVTLAVQNGANATQINAKVTKIGASAPTSGWGVYGTTVTSFVYNKSRLWARPSDGVNNGPWQYWDFNYGW